jgi:phage-related protein
MAKGDRPLVWLRGEVKTPPFSAEARVEAGFLLRLLQKGENLSLPHSRPMSAVGRRCHELRIRDAGHEWRIVYRMDADAIVVADVFEKKTRHTPSQVLARCTRRLDEYDGIHNAGQSKQGKAS